VEGGGGGLTVSGVSRNRGGFVKCVAIQNRLGIPALDQRVGTEMVVVPTLLMLNVPFSYSALEEVMMSSRLGLVD
jgi:hypothetical protein